ncbi:ammosamide/lymphostin RiPP family protein [Streptomyces sp. NPDC086519]|uniref:ammosamide/lymphostin RiPP family protein n=1 Tax=Streptomyces sp. NPDC086519 TaxID=3154863 RepID=UPI00341EE15D
MAEHTSGTVAEEPGGQAQGSGGEGSFEELDQMEFLDDIDFTLDEVESRIAPLALAHR